MTKEELHAFIRETTRLAGELGLVKRVKAGKGVSEATKAAYEKVGARRLDLRSRGLGQLMEGVSARSWHTVRAALLHQAAETFGQGRRACDQAQRDGDLERAARMALVTRRAVMAFERVQVAERPSVDAPRQTKRRSLPRSDDWQARVWEAATPVQRPGIAVLWAVGCRPAEIAMGVDVIRRPRPDGRVIVEVRIPGAKVTEVSGQPSRRLAIDGMTPQGRALLDALGGRDALTIRRPAKRLTKDLAAIRAKIGLKVSPYSLRHQASANLKAELGPAASKKVAEALGHATTRSQGRYGSVRQAQSGGSGVVGVKASREVRETRPGRRLRSGPAPS